jgi:hypothetical protein
MLAAVSTLAIPAALSAISAVFSAISAVKKLFRLKE